MIETYSRPAGCKCREPELDRFDNVRKVWSCPACVGSALEWFGTQLSLFEGEEVVSVSAVLTSEGLQSAIRTVEVVRSDDLPF